MPPDTMCKTIRQYSQDPIPQSDMQKLLEIAKDYRTVKNYVYARYGGISSLMKLYPGYTVQNEMAKEKLRSDLGMPSVYFYLAVFEALGDIRSQWTQVKEKVQKAVGSNENFTPKDVHYLRFVLKISNCFAAILNHMPVGLPEEYQKRYEELALETDIHRLNQYLCRQVRKYLKKLHTDKADGFSIAERAYRYKEHGIYISTKECRKRVFIPLTDNNRYTRQLTVKLYPERNALELLVPIDIHIKRHPDYQNEVGISFGMFTMLTTDEAHTYGEQLGEYMLQRTEWIQAENQSYQRNKKDNPGRKRYTEQKRKLDERLHAYINQELNRFLREEKPQAVYLPKLPANSPRGKVKKYNQMAGLWQRGYIRRRLLQKCREQSIEAMEVLGKDISRECSHCGGIGDKKETDFHCPVCGLVLDNKVNAARNARKRGQAADRISKDHKNGTINK